MQVARPRVITEPRPQMQHLIHRRIGERAHIREARDKALVVGNHGPDLCLLQHDLGHPYAVGRAVLLPGKVMAPVAGVPLKQRGGDGFGGDGHPPILAALRGTHRAPGRPCVKCGACGSLALEAHLRSHSCTSPLMVFRCMCPAPSPRVPCSVRPGMWPRSLAVALKQLEMSPLKVEIS